MVNDAKKGWQHQTHERAAMVFDQMRLAIDALHKTGRMSGREFLDDPRNPYLQKLDELYGEDFQLGRLMDVSDLILHAEGPSADDFLPTLNAANWLYDTANRQLRELAVAPLMLPVKEDRALRRKVDLRMTGMAPGSIYAGFKLMPPDDDIFPGEDCDFFHSTLRRIAHLSSLPSFIEDERINPSLSEVIDDPAERDISLAVAHALSPTGKRGIHTVELSIPGSEPQVLSLRERTVLQDALKKPAMGRQQHGAFVGSVREFDMDKMRFHLREVDQVGAVRCVFNKQLTKQKVKDLMGETVRVSGSYETDRDGRPRLMLVESIDVQATPRQADIHD